MSEQAIRNPCDGCGREIHPQMDHLCDDCAATPRITGGDELVERAEQIIDAYKPELMPNLLPPNSHRQGLERAAKVLAALTANKDGLVEALEFYANPEIYKPHPHGSAFDDRDLSFRAKSALAAHRDGQ